MLCSRDFLATKVLKKGGRVYQEFPWKVFCLTVPKNLVGEQPFCAVFQKICGSEKVSKKRGKEYQKFQSKVFLSHSVGKFGSGTTLLCRVSEKFWQRKSFEKQGEEY